MTKRIKSLRVDKISLLTEEHSPAVPKAGIGFSIMKFLKFPTAAKPDSGRLDAVIAKLATASGPSKLDAAISKLEAVSAKNRA